MVTGKSGACNPEIILYCVPDNNMHALLGNCMPAVM